MRRSTVDLWSPAIGATGSVVVYGHWGRPVLVFPHEMGRADDFESFGMIDIVADLIEGGRVKLYCVESYDRETWSNRDIPLEERARRHGAYESWILDQVVPWIFDDCGGPADILTTGTSLGAYHAANFALKRADLFPQALCMSGIYDLSALYGWGERGDGPVLQHSAGLSGQYVWRPPGLAAITGLRPAGVRTRDVGGHNWCPRQHQSLWRRARRQGHPA